MGFFDFLKGGNKTDFDRNDFVGSIYLYYPIQIIGDHGEKLYISDNSLTLDIFDNKRNYRFVFSKTGTDVKDEYWERVSYYNVNIKPLQYNIITPFLDLLHKKHVVYDLDENMRLKYFYSFELKYFKEK